MSLTTWWKCTITVVAGLSYLTLLMQKVTFGYDPELFMYVCVYDVHIYITQACARMHTVNTVTTWQ